ncbi:ABC transporter ATP-binding protein [Sediminitomix flava]|uniref:Putative ABC transport system ATP-binding protein n=1 Tax=Sediminitomix flava TaxID=379075 RepID=A0A315Z8B8_SEDFL|nr:ATP-binding cassette domain-containing protein [Sediminitomix flava]PWJ40908.1 putative ABC transport system ATP-binding protein [Sediminitomix flava]
MLQTNQLSFSYSKDGQAFHFPDLSLEKGKHLLILGNSGCGKTTFLHLLAGLLSTKEGEVSLDNTNFSSLSGAQMDTFRAQHIGIVFQKPHFLKSLTIKENLETAQFLAKQPTDKARIDALLEKLGISHRKNAKVSELSEGEKQRASIALALINKPSLILADEPTASLDDENTQEVIELLKQRAAEENASLVIVTHDQRLKTEFPTQLVLHKLNESTHETL